MSIPSSPDELTPAWLSEVLAADVAAVEVIDAHTGTTGRARIRVTAEAGIPETLFVKLQPFDASQRDLLRVIGLGVAEANFYAEVGNDLPVRVPRVWHSSFDVSDGSFIMVLEDLEAAGCRFTSPEDPEVLQVTVSLVDELATLHAKYWGEELRWLGTQALNPENGPDAERRLAMGASRVQSANDQFAGDLPPEFRELCQVYTDRYSDIWALFKEGESTLIHGDNHIGNLFVDGDRTGFYDWAVANRYPGMRDVSYFLCNSVPTDLRRAEQDALLTRYRAGLAEKSVELDSKVAYDQYRLFSVYSWMSATTTAAMGSKWQPIEVGMRSMERTTQAIIDLDVLGLLNERLGSS